MKACAVEICRVRVDSEEASPKTGYCVFVPDQGFVPNPQGQLLHASRTAALETVFASTPRSQRLYVLFSAQPHLTLRPA